MNKENKFKAICKNTFTKTKTFFKESAIKCKNSFLLLIISTIIFGLVLILVPKFYNTFYNCNTDDVIQYYPYIAGFFEKIKTGTLSIYDTALFGGTSFFSGTYYIPIDIFLVLAFFLSFVLGVYKAYFVTLLLKIFTGSYLLFYVLKRHKVRPLVCFVIALVYSLTGLMQAYFVFPVYLGIIFYVPLSMLITDMFLEEKTKYLSTYLIPIFVIVLVLFDYYLAYMLLAFMAIYYLYRANTLSREYLFLNKKTLIQFVSFLSLIILGVFISAAVLLPSALYIMNETSRTNNNYDKLFYFTRWNSDTQSYVISLRHYFTQLMNFYIPNNPHVFMLVEAGDYVREHATLYMTLGIYIYLIKSLTLGDKKSNILRFYTIALNVMFLIPLFSMIFTAQKVAYVRWFFIPYMFNLLTAAHTMDVTNFKIFETKNNKFKTIINVLLPLISLVIAFALVLFVLIKNPDYFIHYDKNSTSDYFFLGILIPTLVFIAIYLVIILLPIGIKDLRKYKTYYIKLIPVVVLCELIFSTVITIISIGSRSCENEYESSSKQVKYLRSVSNYNFSDGYRINLYTNKKCLANNNVALLNVNCTNFFQSFYNTPLNRYMNEINEIYTTSWSRRSIYGYSLLNGPQYNNKYVITNSQSITSDTLLDQKVVTRPVVLSNKYYKKYDDYSYASYYEATSMPNFIVYDSVYYGSSNYAEYSSTFMKDISLLNYGYASLGTSVCSSSTTLDYLISNYEYLLDKCDTTEKSYLESFKLLYDNGLITCNKEEAFKKLHKQYNVDSVSLSSTSKNTNSKYFIYDLSSLSENQKKIFDHDQIYAYAFDSNITTLDVNSERYWMYFSSNDYDSTDRLILNPFHYNVSYIKDLGYTSQSAPDTFYMRYKAESNTSGVTLYGYDDNIYDDFIENQAKYTNRSYSLDSNIMKIKFDNDSKSKVIKTAYTYSTDWEIVNNDLGYKTVNINGGFLGVIVPEGVDKVDITLRFNPKGMDQGLKLNEIGVIIYFSIVSLGLLYETKKKIGDCL